MLPLLLALLLADTRARLVSNVVQDNESIVAAIRGDAATLVLVADEERGDVQAAGLIAIIGTNERIVTSTRATLDREQARPPFVLGAPAFVDAIALGGDRFLIVSRELAGEQRVFVAEIDGTAMRARYVPELDEKDIHRARMVSDGRGGAWIVYVSHGVLEAARISSRGIESGAFVIGSASDEFAIAALGEGCVMVVTTSMEMFVIDSEGFVTTRRELLDAMVTQPSIAIDGDDNVVIAWREGRALRVGTWTRDGECVVAPREFARDCSDPRVTRERVAWRCGDATLHVATLPELRDMTTVESRTRIRFFTLANDALLWSEGNATLHERKLDQ